MKNESCNVNVYMSSNARLIIYEYIAAQRKAYL